MYRVRRGHLALYTALYSVLELIMALYTALYSVLEPNRGLEASLRHLSPCVPAVDQQVWTSGHVGRRVVPRVVH